MSKTNLVSVVVPFYGRFARERLNLVEKSVANQKGIAVEFVIAEDNGISSPTAPRVLNNAIYNKASGEYIYVNDADILFSQENYIGSLFKLSQENKYAPLKRPPMRRLLLEDYDSFCSLVNANGLEETINRLDYSQEFVVKMNNYQKNIRVFKKTENGREKIFIASEDDFQEYINNEENKGKEPRFWNQDRHCGGTFFKKNQFERIGGYCEQFISWGCWDADLQWKLEELFGMKLIPNIKDFEVVHMDHPKGYFDEEKWKIDRDLQTKRRKLGGVECSDLDRKKSLGRQYEQR